MSKYRVTIFGDEATDFPPSDIESGLFTVHSFSKRHEAFTDPGILLACYVCGYEKEDHPVLDESADDGSYECEAYQGPSGFFLSYFEHGQCLWGRAGTMSRMPDFRWDGVGIAGFLEIHEDWFLELPIEEQQRQVDNFLTEYTSWCNGEVYGFAIEEIEESRCDLGFTHESSTLLESLGGYIGSDQIEDGVSQFLGAYEIHEEDTEIVDRAYGMADYLNLWEEVKA